MLAVTVNAHGHGDGWLSVDTDEWVADRMVLDDNRTESLHEWLRGRDHDTDATDYSGNHYATRDRVMRWARTTIRGVQWDDKYGPFLEEVAYSMATQNYSDVLLDDEIGAVWFAGDDGTYFVETNRGAMGCYVQPTVYRVTGDPDSLHDYARASSECRNGHRWDTEDGGVHLDNGRTWLRLDSRIRVPFGNTARAYVACPDCGKALMFGMW